MEARMLVFGLALLTAFGAAFSVAFLVVAATRRRIGTIAAQGETLSARSVLGWRLRNGYKFLLPLSQNLLEIEGVSDWAHTVVSLLAQKGWSATEQSVLTVVIAWVLAAGGMVGLATGSVVGAFAIALCAVVALASAVGHLRDKDQEAARDAVPGALESMTACLGSGFTLLQTFEQVAQDTPGPLAETFSRAAHVLEMGGSAENALYEMRNGVHASELTFVAVALDVQHQSGGAMKQVLEAATDSVKGELALRRSLRVQTAQAKLSARVVVVMPFILVAAFSLASPDFLSPFFSSPFGYALLSLALIMEVAGIVLVKRALAVEGVA